MLPPLPRCSGWTYSSLIHSSRISLPRKGRRVGLHIVLFEACSAFTRVAACTLALSPIRDTLSRRLQPLRYLHSCSGCFRLERLPGGTCTHWKTPPCHGAHPFQTSRSPHPRGATTELVTSRISVKMLALPRAIVQKARIMEVIRSLVTLLGTFLKWSREVGRGIQKIASLRVTRRSDAVGRLSAKCPKCGESDFRTSDRQRTRPDVYGSSTFRLKWLCLTCGYRTIEYVEEPN